MSRQTEGKLVRGQWIPSDEDERELPAPKQRTRTTPPPKKTSYESSPDVQWWLSQESLQKREKPPFEPTFLAGLRDSLWLLSSFEHFYERDLISDVLHVVRSGKEATVYCCKGDVAANEPLVAAKVYRPRMFRSLSNDAIYRGGRAQHDENGAVMRGNRRGGPSRGSERGRAFQVMAWIGFEYETLTILHRAGVAVPRPIAQSGNAVLMEYIGAEREPAPLLRNVTDLRTSEARQLCDDLMHQVEQALAAYRVHGDLSAYNVLYWQGRGVLIDWAQGVDPRHSNDALDLLERDISRLGDYFATYGIEINANARARDMWERRIGRV